MKDFQNAFEALGGLAKSVRSRVVAVEPLGDHEARVFIRGEDGRVRAETEPFRPFLLLSSADMLADFDGPAEVSPLAGPGRFAWLARFDGLKTLDKALKFLKKSTGKTPSASGAPYLSFSNVRQMVLMDRSLRLFHGMRLQDARRFFFDIETATSEGYDFPNPIRPDDRIVMIALRDSDGWERCLSAATLSEKAILEGFVAAVVERDPDTLEGHNIFRFDLPFIEARAKRHGVPLRLGRDGSEIEARASRMSVGEQLLNYRRYDIFGRHLIDTFLLTRLYDAVYRELPDYGLKTVARHFGVSAPDRTYLDASKMNALFAAAPETVTAYAMDDVRETHAISDILSPSYFYQTWLVPFSYQDCAVRGNATRVDAMMIDAYFQERAAVPIPSAAKPFEGGLTDALKTGVFQNVWHADVRSLYPSILIAERWAPAADALGRFPFFIKALRDFRLQAREREKKAETAAEKDCFGALQNAFKIVINSFYGYLGFPQGAFNDFDLAARVTARGREILTLMLEFLEKRGGEVIEMDTDGLYFLPPKDVAQPAALEAELQAALPSGVTVEIDGVYQAIFCYKSKNYATLDARGEIGVTGAALKSRGMEPFLRRYVRDFVHAALTGGKDRLPALTEALRRQLTDRQLPLEDLAKSETLNDSPEAYKKKLESGKGRRSAVYELALNSKREYLQGDQVVYYVTGDKAKVSVTDNSRLLIDAPPERDENIAYYLARLEETYKKLSEA